MHDTDDDTIANPNSINEISISECRVCGEIVLEGGGTNLGDETFSWFCANCRGDSAILEYGVDAEDVDVALATGEAEDGSLEIRAAVTLVRDRR